MPDESPVIGSPPGPDPADGTPTDGASNEGAPTGTPSGVSSTGAAVPPPPPDAPPPPAGGGWSTPTGGAPPHPPAPAATAFQQPFAARPVAARPVGALRLPVVALAVLAVLAVAGLFVWDGGDQPVQAGPGAAGGGSSGSGLDGAPAIPGSAGATVNGVPSVSMSEPPLDPAALAPNGGTPITPPTSGALVAWRVPGDWDDNLEPYVRDFPVAGYAIAGQRIVNGAGGGAWDVVVAGPGSRPASGLLYIEPDPQDPSSTIVQYEDRNP